MSFTVKPKEAMWDLLAFKLEWKWASRYSLSGLSRKCLIIKTAITFEHLQNRKCYLTIYSVHYGCWFLIGGRKKRNITKALMSPYYGYYIDTFLKYIIRQISIIAINMVVANRQITTQF